MIKNPSDSIQYNCQMICSWKRRPETNLKIRKDATIFKEVNKPIV